MTDLDFYFDIASPNAYLAYKCLPTLQQRTGVKINYIPCLLGGIFKATNNQSPMQAFAYVRNKMEYELLEMRRFIARHGLSSFQMNPHFPVNTLLVMRAAVVAERMGCLARYMDVMFASMWEQGLKLDDPAVVQQALTTAGLDGNAILAASSTSEIKQQLIDYTDAVVERGAFGLPVFFIGKEMWFGKERLQEIEQYLLG